MTELESWLAMPPANIDREAILAAQERQQQLTKPAGSLGELETIAITLAGLLATSTPHIEKIQITIFAGDHGVATEGVSAYPQAVTAEMVRNFARGGAAISVLAKQLGAQLNIINMGTVSEIEPLDNVHDQRIAAGTTSFLSQAAMTTEQCERAIAIGRAHVEQLQQQGLDLFIGGEMGIGNTTSATAIACALLNKTAEELTGAGTGLDAAGILHKATMIQQALDVHQTVFSSPMAVLQHLGGFEIAALTGAYLSCAKQGIPVLVDGYICTVAALLAEHLAPGSKEWFLMSHRSDESAHQLLIEALGKKSLLDLAMRLGEASGAAVTVPLLRLSCALHNQMATFAEAGVSQA